MYIDLNIPFKVPEELNYGKPVNSNNSSKKSKGKQPQPTPSNMSVINRDDINLQWKDIPQIEVKSLETRTKMLIHLGYKCLAFEQYIDKFNPQTHLNIFPKTKPVFPDLDPRSNPNNPRSILQLKRLTIELDERSSTHSFNQGSVNIFNEYDILAVRPTGINSFNNACLNLTTPSPFAVYIISIDLASNPRLPFNLRRSTVGKAIKDGACFEICYGDALDSNSDFSRRNLIAGAKEIMRVTGGKGVILTSKVSTALHLRGPHDVINLGTVFGVNHSIAKKAISDNCKQVIKNSESRKVFRGIFTDLEIKPKRENKNELNDNQNKKQKLH